MAQTTFLSADGFVGHLVGHGTYIALPAHQVGREDHVGVEVGLASDTAHQVLVADLGQWHRGGGEGTERLERESQRHTTLGQQLG